MSDREIEKILKSLANKRRINIVRYLIKKKEASVMDIADQIKLSFKATSKHLSILFSVNVVDRKQKSLQVFYRISSDIPDFANKILSLL